jgi:hypothetical protein
MQKSTPSQIENLTGELDKLNKKIDDMEEYLEVKYNPIENLTRELKKLNKKIDEMEEYLGVKYNPIRNNLYEAEITEHFMEMERERAKRDPSGVNDQAYIKRAREKEDMYYKLQKLYKKEKKWKKEIMQEKWLKKYLKYAKKNNIKYEIDEYDKDNLFERCNEHHQNKLLETGFLVNIRGHKFGCRSDCSGWYTNEDECECGYSHGWEMRRMEYETLEEFNIESTHPGGVLSGGRWSRNAFYDVDDSDNYENEENDEENDNEENDENNDENDEENDENDEENKENEENDEENEEENDDN